MQAVVSAPEDALRYNEPISVENLTPFAEKLATPATAGLSNVPPNPVNTAMQSRSEKEDRVTVSVSAVVLPKIS